MRANGNRPGAWRARGHREEASATSSLEVKPFRLFHVDQLDIENQRRVRRDDAARAPCAVAHLRRDDQGALPSDAHAGYALVPALDDAALADHESKRRVAIQGAIEF